MKFPCGLMELRDIPEFAVKIGLHRAFDITSCRGARGLYLIKSSEDVVYVGQSINAINRATFSAHEAFQRMSQSGLDQRECKIMFFPIENSALDEPERVLIELYAPRFNRVKPRGYSPYNKMSRSPWKF